MKQRQGSPGFPEKHRDVLLQVCEDASAELVREPEVLVIENVLNSLMENVALDIEMVTAFGNPILTVPDKGATPQSPAMLHYNFHPTYNDSVIATKELTRYPVLTGSSVKDNRFFRCIYQDTVGSFTSLLHRKYGDDVLIAANMFYAWSEYDAAREVNHNVTLKGARDIARMEHNVTAINVIWNHSDDEEQKKRSRVESFAAFGEYFNALNKIPRTKEVTKGIEIGVYLIATREQVRREFLLALQSYRLIPHAVLAETIAQQGTRTFRNMEGMTEYDLNSKLKKLIEEYARNAEKPERNSSKPIEEGDPENFVNISEEKRKLWRKSNKFLETNEFENRRPLKEILDTEGSKREIKMLSDCAEWVALTGKEKEIMQRVFAEVSKFSYASNMSDGEDYTLRSHIIGMPAFAAENRALNCFSGAWMIAALCLECGIPYSRLFYCDVNRAQSSSWAGSHGAILVIHPDGSNSFIDFGYKTSGRQFGVKTIKDHREQKKLEKFFIITSGLAAHNQKAFLDPVRVRIPQETADLTKTYSDMHVMSLDQAVGALSLLNTGIMFQEKGQPKEALQAFELGLVLYPNSSDLLCRCGMIAIDNNELERAKRFLDLALHACNHHQLSLYYRGILALKVNDDECANHCFSLLAADQHKPWGDDSFKKRAEEYSASRLTIHLANDLAKKGIIDSDHGDVSVSVSSFNSVCVEGEC